MKKIFKNYKSTIIMFISVILGTLIGVIFKEKATILKPFGTLFINLLLTIIVPLIFLTLSTSIGKMKEPKRLGKILITIIGIFVLTSLISVLIGIASTKITLVNKKDSIKIKESFDYSITDNDEKLDILTRTVNAISTDDFVKIISKDNIIALIVISILTGLAIHFAKDKGKKALEVLESFNDVLQMLIKIIMYYAPIGIGAYFASFVGEFGAGVATSYLKMLIIYTVSCAFVYFVIYSLYAFIAGGKKGLKLYWQNIMVPSATALATCSSAASIPVNTKAAKNIGVSDDIADTIIPLGTSFHKDGSIIGSVFKIMFLVYLFGMDVSTFKVLGVSILATILITAVPIGGGTISEMLIISLMGFPIASLPILTIIATIIDAPATLLNVVGDSASSMLVARIIDGKNWLNKKQKF
ncbi:MAG: dicarboxylate/amino acid:cation symporter [Bacilli bacterium]|nr:dicarboxylate/amino acid:cation symporter [Bacilli bacterium]